MGRACAYGHGRPWAGPAFMGFCQRHDQRLHAQLLPCHEGVFMPFAIISRAANLRTTPSRCSVLFGCAVIPRGQGFYKSYSIRYVYEVLVLAI